MRDPFLEDLWRESVGLPPKNLLGNHPGLTQLKQSQWDQGFETLMRKYHKDIVFTTYEWDAEFIQYMKNRLVMGSFRYGLMSEQDYSIYDLTGYIENKLKLFESTENLEYLVDAANNCMLAYIHGCRIHGSCDVISEDEICIAVMEYDLEKQSIAHYKEQNKPTWMPALAARLMTLFTYSKKAGGKMDCADNQGHAKEIIK